MTDQLTAYAPRRVLRHDLLSSDSILSYDATTLFVDLEGFTTLTDRLGRFGSRGTEQLSEVLRDFFGRVTNAVAGFGGDLVAYSGDALTVVFDGAAGPTLEAATSAAHEIGRLSGGVSGISTLAGSLSLRTRVGIARGDVTTAVARSSRRCIAVNLGRGIDLAVAAEAVAEVGEIVVDTASLKRSTSSEAGEAGRQRAPETTAGCRSAGVRLAGPASHTGLSGLVSPVVLDRLASNAPLESHRRISTAFARFPPVDPSDVRPFLARVSVLLELVDGWEGELVQVCGGDKGVVAMVVFGAPLTHGDDALRAVEAMLELRKGVPKVAAGVATGPVFTALLGSRTRVFPTHTGIAVSTAARLMQEAQGGQLLVDRETWLETSGRLRRVGPPTVQAVKGRLTEVEVHEVRGRRRPRSRAVSDARPPLVGRRAEMAALEELFDNVTRGRGGVVVLQGDPGIGKTRLVQEAVDRAGTRGFVVATSDVADHPRGRPQEMWREVLGSLVGVPSRGGAKRWETALAAHLPEAEANLGRLAPLLGLALDVAHPDAQSSAGAPLHAELAEGVLANLLCTLSSKRPVLVSIDNADHLDETSIRILTALAALLTRSRTGVILTSSTSSPSVARLSASRGQMLLTELSPAEVAAVATDAWRQAGGGNAPPWLAEAAYRRAGGNPLFVRTVTWELHDRWRPGSPPPLLSDDAESPLGGLLAQRIDRLDGRARHLLHLLSAAGRPCSPRVAAIVSDGLVDATAARRAAAALAAERLVEVDVDHDEERYRLAHDQLRQVVYESMSHDERDRLHRRLVTCLSELGADPLEIAEHVRHLGDRELARRWFPLAAASARRSWNLSDAVTYLQGVRPLLVGREREEVDVELLEVLLVAGRANEVLRQSTDFPTPAPTAPDRRQERLLAARRLHITAQAAQACGQFDRSETAAEQAMRLIGTLDEARYQRSAELLVLARCERGATREAVAKARELLARAAIAQDDAALTTAHAALGAALLLSGRPDEAAVEYNQALTGARARGDAVQQVHVLSDLAGCAFETSRFTECAALLADAREVADKIGYRRHLAFNLSNEAQLRAGLADPYAAPCAAESIQRSLDMGDLACAANALHTWLTTVPSLAANAAQWRRLANIDSLLDRPLLTTRDHVCAAVAAARAGRWKDSVALATAAETAARELDQPQLLRRATLARLVATYSAGGRGSAADRAALAAALDELRDASDADPVERAEIAVERWRVTRTPGDHGAAVELASEAFGAQPSAAVRAWLQELGAPEPDPPPELPPPGGIRGVRATRAQLDEAFRRVESGLRLRDERAAVFASQPAG